MKKNRFLLDNFYTQTLNLKYKEENFYSELCITSASFDDLKGNNSSFLHKNEREYYSTLVSDKRRESYLLGRFSAKKAISKLNKDHPLHFIEIKNGVLNHPVAFMQNNQKIQVSYSHADEIGMALAFPEILLMGVDIEKITSSIDSIESIFENDEKNLLLTIPFLKKTESYTLFWTIKEALSKTIRTGLTSPLRIFSIKNISVVDNIWISEFDNFPQYYAYSFFMGKYACSIVCPKQVQFLIDIPSINNWYYKLDLRNN